MIVNIQLLRAAQASTAFLWNQAVRVVPLYWMLTSVLLILLLTMPGVADAPFDGPLDALQSYTTTSFLWDKASLLYLGWTLEYGAFLYLIVGGALLLILPPNRSSLGLLLGNASYAIYLVQILSLPIFFRLCSTAWTNVPPDLICLMATAFTATSGIALHWMVEQPLTRVIRQGKLNHLRPPMQNSLDAYMKGTQRWCGI